MSPEVPSGDGEMVSRGPELATCRGRTVGSQTVQKGEGGIQEQEQERSSEGAQDRWQASSEAGQAPVDPVVRRSPGDQCVDTFRARGREARS